MLETLTIVLGSVLALLGLAGKTKGESLRAGWGVMIGTLFVTIVRLGVSGIRIYYFVIAL